MQPSVNAHANWDELAAFLLRAEKSMSWGSTHSSFSGWLSDLSKRLGRGEATLWRALAAGRYYNELSSEFAERGQTIPKLGSGAVLATPEVLELADKLSRVAPAELVQSIVEKVVDGKISRRELRTYWETYRPVLQGLTARGRNVIAPRFNPRNIDMISRRLEADCIAGLIKDGSTWLGSDRAHLYKVIPMTQPLTPKLGIRFVPDVIVLYQTEPQSRLELHGVEATVRPDHDRVLRHYRVCGLGLDFLWIAAPTETESRNVRKCTELGLLEANTSGVRVVRPASPAKLDRDAMTNTLRGLLAREIAA